MRREVSLLILIIPTQHNDRQRNYFQYHLSFI